MRLFLTAGAMKITNNPFACKVGKQGHITSQGIFMPRFDSFETLQGKKGFGLTQSVSIRTPIRRRTTKYH
jgi:hypothetical protein